MTNLEKLRKHMKKSGVCATVIPTADPHLSEYVPECFKLRRYISGFTGSAGTLVVTENCAGLWTDGRYYIQAENELSGSEIRLYRASEKNTIKIYDFLKENLPDNAVVGVDGRLFSKKYLDEFISKLGKITVNADYDPSEIWENRPELPSEKAFLLDECYCGESALSKIDRVRKIMQKECFTHYLVTSPEAVMWLLNIRGNDVKHTPVMLSYLLLSKEKAALYVNEAKLSEEVSGYLNRHNIEVADYGEIYEDISRLPQDSYLNADFSLTYYTLINRASCPKKDFKDIITELKCIKNKTEIDNIKKAYEKENIALTKAFYEIYHTEGIDECDVCEIIEKYRSKSEGYFGSRAYGRCNRPAFSLSLQRAGSKPDLHGNGQRKRNPLQ